MGASADGVLFRRPQDRTPLQRDDIEIETPRPILEQTRTRGVGESFSYEDFCLLPEDYVTEADILCGAPFTPFPSDQASGAAATPPRTNPSDSSLSILALDKTAKPASQSWSRFIETFPLLQESLHTEVTQFFAQ